MKWLKKLFGSKLSTSADNGSVAINGNNYSPITINNGIENFNIKSFSVWSKTPEFERYSFISVEARTQVIIECRELLKLPQKCTRIVGLSGLGKTRTAFEIFKDDVYLQDLVVYIDAVNVSNITGLLSEWISSGLRKVIVVDNCDANIHKQIQKEVCRTDSQLSLLTLDYNLERVSNTTFEFHLKPLSTLEIKGMLENIYTARQS
jgi:hypothetical protein